MYREITNGLQIDVEPEYVPEQSNPCMGLYFFSYTVKITNLSQRPAQVLRRYWMIRDGQGRVREVRGDGVVGMQPTIEPGGTFEYSSFCPLPTPTGNMRGEYLWTNDAGEHFKSTIPLFFLRDTRTFANSPAWVI